MIETYDILFSVNFRHTYYHDGRCKAISVRPDQATQLLFRKYGFIYRQKEDGFVILAESNKNSGVAVLSSKVEKDLQFNFLLKLENPYFLNITDIAEPEINSSYFFSNKLIDKTGDSINFKSGNFTQLITNSFELDKNLGEEGIFERNGNSFTIQPQTTPESFIYNTSGLDAGVFSYRSKNFSQNLFISTGSFTNQVFAVLSIDLNDQNIMDTENKMLKPAYNLQFETRETFWQYILNVRQNAESLVIESSGDEEEFEKSESENVVNKSVVVFTSKNQIPITETRNDYFRLKVRNGDPANDLILISKLPIPEMSVLNQNKEGKIYTPIYVNF